MIFASRRGRGPDPFLERKVQIFFAGAVVALFGIAVESSLLVGLAALLLLGGILARFLPGTRSPSGGDDPEQEETYVEEESEES